MDLIRRLVPPVQESHCSKCDLLIRERRRKPCPRCGGMNRRLERFAFDGLGTSDKAV